MLKGIRNTIANLLQSLATRLASVTVDMKVGDLDGWTAHQARPNDRPHAEIQQLYQDALTATRKNPLAKSIVNITTDFAIGDGIRLSSPLSRYNTFIKKFWNHPKNLIDSRLQAISDELTRSGDLFILLFRNPVDGMSYLRFVTKDQIQFIETAENDWETEIAYHQIQPYNAEPIIWYSPRHPAAAEAEAIMLHYSINKPIGASMGEGDLDTIIPWLLRYSRMLEDRVRLNWAVRSHLWLVTVPTAQVAAKREQYASPPEPGSIIVKDDAEEWEVQAPTLHASDARHDLQSVRNMIDASGYPPHWRGEGGDANLATATAMQVRPERHLRRRQNYIVYILQDLIYHAYVRAWEIGKVSSKAPAINYKELYSADVTDVSRTDNEFLATSARELAGAFAELTATIGQSETLSRLALELILKFAGESQDDDVIQQIMEELEPPGQAEPAVDVDGEEEQNQAKSNGHNLTHYSMLNEVEPMTED